MVAYHWRTFLDSSYRYKERTIYNTIEREKDEGSLKDNLRTGRPTVLDTHQSKRLKRLVNNRTGVSQRRLEQKFQVNQTTIGRALEKMRISMYKREKTPRYTEKQMNCAGNSPICFTEILAP